MAELAELFLRDTRVNLEKIERAAQAGDGRSAGEAAHALKGSAGNFGATGLAELSKDAEQRATGGEVARTLEMVADIAREFDRVTAALHREFELDAREREGAERSR
jgi:HPt (histidine-containing phosphotransfer) domain-containing protein